MAKLLALYNQPTDTAAFDAYYEPTHVPMARKIPGLTNLEMSTSPVMTPQGPAPYYRVGVLTFDSMADLQAAFASPEGQAAAGDIPNFASGGATLLIFDTKPLL
jgi:uncharacterized protein (TIGR02118 family)